MSVYIYICHNFFIHSFTNEHLSSFCTLATVNTPAMNTGTQISLLISVFFFPLRKYTAVELQDYMVLLLLVSARTSRKYIFET